jgi:hypothetical protein
MDSKSLLRSIIQHKLLPNNSKIEAVIEDPQLPAIDPKASQTNIPPKPEADQNEAVIQDGESVQTEKKGGNHPKFEMESMLKTLAVIEYQMERCKDDSYIKEMDDQDKEKVEALSSAVSAMKQTISEMVAAWE